MTQSDALFPPTGGPSPLDAATALGESVSTMLRLAETLTAGGRRVDLTGLDGLVGRLCAQILDLPPAEGRALRPQLEAIRADLDRLAASLPP